MDLTPEAQRAGRASLGWGVRDLATGTGVASTTVNRVKNRGPMRWSAAAKIVDALDGHGGELAARRDRTGAVLVFAQRR
jgi:hypothetical protein